MRLLWFLRYLSAYGSFRALLREIDADSEVFGNPARNNYRCAAWVRLARW